MDYDSRAAISRYICITQKSNFANRYMCLLIMKSSDGCAQNVFSFFKAFKSQFNLCQSQFLNINTSSMINNHIIILYNLIVRNSLVDYFFGQNR